MVLAAIAGLLSLAAFLARPFWGLVLFTVLLYTRPEESFPALEGAHLALLVSLATLFGTWRRLGLAGETGIRAPIHGTIPAFGLVALLSTIPDGNTLAAAQEIGKLVVLVYLVLNLVRTPERYRTLTVTLLVCTGYLAAYAIYRYHTGRALATAEEARALATGLFGDPNDLATVVTAGLGLVPARIVGGRPAARLAYLLLAVVMIWAVLLTRSRGGMLALLFVLGGSVLLYFPRRVLAGGLALLVVIAVLTLGPGRMRNFDSREASANGRLAAWGNGLVQLVSHPLLGVGYGRFEEVNDDRAAHNTFLQCATETGFVGYFFWMGALYYCFRRPHRRGEGPGGIGADKEPSSPGRAAAELAGARLALGAYLVGAFWLSHAYFPTLYLLLSLPIAQQIAMAGDASRGTAEGTVRFPDAVRIGLLCLGSILLIKLSVALLL
jgi:hypothetical protein